MNAFGDDISEMSNSGFGDTLLLDFLDELHAWGTAADPVPSAELDAAFRAMPVVGAHRRRVARRRRAVSVAAVAAMAMGLTGVAAAADVLPQPAQRAVVRVVNDTTPFHIGTRTHHGPAVHNGPGLPTAPPRPSNPVPATTGRSPEGPGETHEPSQPSEPSDTGERSQPSDSSQPSETTTPARGGEVTGHATEPESTRHVGSTDPSRSHDD